jgi:hypothetical protein
VAPISRIRSHAQFLGAGVRNISSGHDTVSLLSQASNTRRLSLRDVQRHSPLESEAVRNEFIVLFPCSGHHSITQILTHVRTRIFNVLWRTTRPITKMQPSTTRDNQS